MRYAERVAEAQAQGQEIQEVNEANIKIRPISVCSAELAVYMKALSNFARGDALIEFRDLQMAVFAKAATSKACLLYTSPSPRDS